MTDPIADFLTRIRNAQMAGHGSVRMPYSKMKENVAQVMLSNKFLESVKVEAGDKFNELVLGLPEQKMSLKRVSKPGQRIYTSSEDIRKVVNGFGIAVISTSQGMMTGYQARKAGIGGEYICQVS